MPFTFAHPAAVIPLYRLLRKQTVLSALVAGSIAPDFQYFLPLDVHRGDSHSLAGLLWFCLPVAMGLYLLFHLLLKAPTLALLPDRMRARLPTSLHVRLPQASGLSIAASLLLGALTHLAWDAFTHGDGLGVHAIPILRTSLFSGSAHPVALYKVLQHGSALLGLALLAWWGRAWLRTAPVQATTPPDILPVGVRLRILTTLAILPTAVGLLVATENAMQAYVRYPASEFLRDSIIHAVPTFGLLWIAYSILWRFEMHKRKNRQRPDAGT